MIKGGVKPSLISLLFFPLYAPDEWSVQPRNRVLACTSTWLLGVHCWNTTIPYAFQSKIAYTIKYCSRIHNIDISSRKGIKMNKTEPKKHIPSKDLLKLAKK